MDFNGVFRIETGKQALTVERMRQIARVLGVKPSELLNDEDVEFRADERGMELIRELEEIPVEDRTQTLIAARELVRLARHMAAQHSAGALGGDQRQLGELADLWNTFDHGARARALELLRLTSSS